MLILVLDGARVFVVQTSLQLDPTLVICSPQQEGRLLVCFLSCCSGGEGLKKWGRAAAAADNPAGGSCVGVFLFFKEEHD